MAISLSNEIKALLDAPNFAHLATLMPDGSPQSVPVWVGREGDRILICTGEGSLKAKNTRRDPELLGRVVAGSDVVITAAVIPGKKPPVLVTAEMVKEMAPGSVILDLAAERGGNCELTSPGQTVVAHGVTIIGRINVSSGVPYHASQMYARNVTAFLLHLVKDGKVRLDQEDEIIRETLLTRGGEVVNQRVREFFSQPSAVSPSGP